MTLRAASAAWLALAAPLASHARAETVEETLATHGLAASAGAPWEKDGTAQTDAVDDAADLFVIAFHEKSGEGERLADLVRISVLDKERQVWTHAALPRRRNTPPEWKLGSVVAIHHSAEQVYLDTHWSPSAGTLVVLSRSLEPIAAVPGWLVALLPGDTVLYHRSMTHFAPTHSAELWTWSAARGSSRLYPERPWGALRQAYVEQVRQIYSGLGEAWFRDNNHHMDPEQFDSALVGEVAMCADGRTLAFRMRFGGGERTPAATPVRDVMVRCTEAGTPRARCRESDSGAGEAPQTVLQCTAPAASSRSSLNP